MTTRILALTGLYTAWVEKEGLEKVSADEQPVDDLTETQQNVIYNFIEMWDEAEEAGAEGE